MTSSNSDNNIHRKSPYSSFYQESNTFDHNYQEPIQNNKTIDIKQNPSIQQSHQTQPTHHAQSNKYLLGENPDEGSYSNNSNYNTNSSYNSQQVGHSNVLYDKSSTSERTIKQISQDSVSRKQSQLSSTTKANKDVDPYEVNTKHDSTSIVDGSNRPGLSLQPVMNKAVNPIINSSVDENDNVLLDEWKSLTKLRLRFKNIAMRNDDILPSEDRKRIKLVGILKYLTYSTYFALFIVNLNKGVQQGKFPDFLSKYRYSVKYFAGFIMMFTSFNIYIELLYTNTFNNMFNDMKLSEAENKLNELKQTILPVKY